MSSPNTPGPTPESNARDIAALTQALNTVVSQFVRPSAQQANANRETLDRVTEILERHATGLLTLEQRLEGIADIVADTAQQQNANAQQIAHNAEAITALSGRSAQFDTKLEETRQLVAKNSSDVAQMNTEMKANIDCLVEENRVFREESRAFRESQQSQLAAIIGNARRLDRLEQQAG